MGIVITDRKINRNPIYRGLLIFLWEHGGETPSGLNKYYGYTYQHLKVLLKAMLSYDYIRKDKEENNKSVIYNITEKGKHLLMKKNYYVTPKSEYKWKSL